MAKVYKKLALLCVSASLFLVTSCVDMGTNSEEKNRVKENTTKISSNQSIDEKIEKYLTLKVEYSLPEKSNVNLELQDKDGTIIRSFHSSEPVEAGHRTLYWTVIRGVAYNVEDAEYVVKLKGINKQEEFNLDSDVRIVTNEKNIISNLEIKNGQKIKNMPVRLSFNKLEDMAITASVISRNGQQLFWKKFFGYHMKGAASYSWDGKRNKGDSIREGDYTFRLESRSSSQPNTIYVTDYSFMYNPTKCKEE